MNIKKNAQISIFVIVGLIIFLISILYINTKFDFKSETLTYEKGYETNSPTKIVKDYVEECLKRQTSNALNHILLQTGNYVQGDYAELPTSSVLLYVDFYEMDTRQYEFNLNELNKTVLLYLYDTMPSCLSFISDDLDRYNISLGNEFNINTRQINNSFSVELYFPIEFEFEDKLYYLEDYKYNINNFPFKLIEDDVNNLLDGMYQDLMEHEPQNQTEFKLDRYNQTLTEIVQRGDTNFLFGQNFLGRNRTTTYTLMYKYPWYVTNVEFRVYDETLEGVN